MMRLVPKPISAQTGVNLIEVLVSMFVLAVGILGVVSLQSVSVQSGIESTRNARAQMITEELADRILANRNGLYSGTISPSATTPAATCGPTVCSSDALATYDLAELSNRLNDELNLPEVQVEVSYDATTFEYSLGVTWDASGDTATFSRPDCVAFADNQSDGCMHTFVRIQ